MSEADINRWHDTIAPPERKPKPWTIGSGGSWDMLEIAPIPDAMLSELAQRYHYAGTPWNCRSMPLSPGDREYMFLLYSSMQGLVARMRMGERMVAEAAALLKACGPDVGEEKRATDAEWDRVADRLQLFLSGKFEELRT
jgi:hypothetical protein